MNNIRISLTGLFLFLAGFLSATAQTADEIVQKHLAAIGGVEKWKNVNSIRTTGTFTSEMQEVKFVLTTLNNKGLRKDFTYVATGLSAFVIITPKAGWSYIPTVGLSSAPKPIPTEIIDRIKNTVTIQSPLIDYKAKGYTVKLAGKQEVNGAECYKLVLNTKGLPDENIFIDANTYYHVRSTQVLEEHDIKDEQITKSYSDFKKLPEGIVYPMTYNEGIGVQTVKTVEINIPVDTLIFKPTVPAEGTK